MVTRRDAGSAAIVLGIAATLTACTAGSGFAVLDRPAGADDVLPFELPDSASHEVEVEVESIRFAAEHDDERLYLARGVTADAICLVVVPRDPDGWSIGCGALGGLDSVQTPAGAYTIRIDGAPVPPGETELTANLSVIG
jgi:hypothetical protein